ncbi:MAG TPA: radical SAM protein, partial [Acidobacteriota bacterium]|nr:radical SAM protein [Acidobacteriota bacterium]
MRVLLVNPKYPEDDIVKRRFIPPIELGYIASLAIQDGHEVKFIDANADNLSAADLGPAIESFRPQSLITVTSSLDRWICPHLKIEESFRILETAKSLNGEIRTALVGPHGTTSPVEMLERSAALDAVVRGEPEWTSREWINAQAGNMDLEKVAGLTFRRNGEIVTTPERAYMENLDALPLPAYHLFPMPKYHYRDHCLQRPFAVALASRGCPYKCTFCLTIMQGKQWRLRNTTKIADELEWLSREHGVRSVMFFDFEFGLNRDRTLDLCREIASRKLPLTWGCEMRVSDAKEDVLRAMKEAGCNFIGFGVESGNQEILNKTKKGITLEQARKAFALTQQLD